MRQGELGHRPRTVPDQPSVAATAALAAVRSGSSNPIIQCFPQGAIVAFDGDLRYLIAGGLGLADVGLARVMLEGNTIYEVFPPETVAAIEPRYRLALAGEESSFDVPYQGRIYLQRLGPLRAADGQIVAGMGFTQDVTVARRHERELHESELRFRLAFEHASIGEAIIAVDGRHELVNPAFCAFTGYTADELILLRMADIIDPADLAADLAAMAGLMADDSASYTMDQRYRTATGATVWGAKSATLLRREDGSPLHFIAQIQDITARKQNEQALLDERRRLRSAESIGRIGSWELDIGPERGAAAITWSAGMFELWGINPDEFDGDYNASREQIHPDDRATLDAAIDQCVTAGTPFLVRYRITRLSDNTQRWIDARGAAVRVDGRVARIGGALADVTELVLADAEATAAQAFQQAVFSASPDIIAVWDYPTASVVWENRSITRLLGYTDQEIAEMPDMRTQVIYGPDLARFDAVLAGARDAVDDAVVLVDYRMVNKDGSLRWLSRRSAPIDRDEQGRVTRIVGVIRDITDAKSAEAALQESEARFRQLAESVNVGFVLRNLDPPGFLYVSPAYEKIYGYNPMTDDEDQQTAVRRIVHPEDLRRTQSTYWAKAAVGQAVQCEFRIIRPGGEVRWVRATSGPVLDPDGVVRRAGSTAEDITERKLAEAAQLSAENLARANTLKSDFLSRMSHELRTPLNEVLGFGQLLEFEELTSSQRDCVQHILRGGRHLVALIDDILDITQIHDGRLEWVTEAVGTDGLLAECLREVRSAAASKGVTLLYEPGDVDVLVQADRGRLAQVLSNLLSNAIKYNQVGGRVTVTRAVSTDGCLEIVVNDTGPGIGTEDLPRLFIPFDRMGAPALGVEGTGLGLTLSRDLMKAMGGTLRAVSQQGVGSTFTVCIPLVAVSAEVAWGSAPGPPRDGMRDQKSADTSQAVTSDGSRPSAGSSVDAISTSPWGNGTG